MSSHSTIFFRSRPRGAQLPLRVIQAMPPRPRGVVHIVVGEVGDDIRRVGVQWFRQVAGIIVGQQHFDRFLGVGFGVADESDRAALDPPGGI